MEIAYIPSPSHGVLHLGPIPLRGYAFCIIIGVFVAVWLGNKRWIARGGRAGTVADIAVWAVPFGLVGGRLYHVITDYELYFSEGRDWVDAFKVWQGGLGIWGAIALGAVGAWIGCRRRGIPLPAWADALAPGIVFAQAIGRWGNWFNQELYGKATDVPWALHITSATDGRVPGYYHPTFLYESLWCVGVGFLVIWADRRFTLGHGRAFALYVAAYCVGRGWIEYMRVDDAHHFLGLRLNDWTAMVVFVLAVTYIVVSARLRPGREEIVEPGADASGEGEGEGDGDAGSGASVGLDKKADEKSDEKADRKPGDQADGESDEKIGVGEKAAGKAGEKTDERTGESSGSGKPGAKAPGKTAGDADAEHGTGATSGAAADAEPGAEVSADSAGAAKSEAESAKKG
ncbi:prolipoprotein diacylglyceryl transferase [Streptomyces sp. NBC_01176]|uniref:prolipoprotein diacylglyceryl transferase n=1 Tax=Streptomyces sp. NBC_01176 TaxID=2903760 RepID=UPI00386C8DAE|nr:prolipoprotein diacylglyceryl transferase [Streptomyces sp. NBC_01176]